MGGCGGTYTPGPLVPNDRTLPMLIASSGECQKLPSQSSLDCLVGASGAACLTTPNSPRKNPQLLHFSFYSPPNELGTSAGRRCSDPCQLIPYQDKGPHLLCSFPVREKSMVNLKEDRLVRLVHRVPAPMRIGALDRCFVFLGGSLHAIVGCELRSARA